MALSKYWDSSIQEDYKQSRQSLASDSPFNNGAMCMFEKEWDGMVNRVVAIFAKENGRKEGLLYNNRLYLSIFNPQEKHKQQYAANRNWILNYYKNLLP